MTRELRVMEAHLLQDCPSPAACWYEPHRRGERLSAEQAGDQRNAEAEVQS